LLKHVGIKLKIPRGFGKNMKFGPKFCLDT
jgi:hypothetical protein